MSAPENTPVPPAAASERRPSLPVAIACLPGRVRLFILVLFACAALPTVVTLYAAVAGAGDTGLLGFLAERPLLTSAAAAILAAAALLLFEQPESWSTRTYAAQLRARARDVRSEYLAAVHRRFSPPGGQP